MSKFFYLNKDYFDKFAKAYMHIFDNVYIRWFPYDLIPYGYKVKYSYSCKFYVKIDDDFVPVFDGQVLLSSRCIRLINVEYLLSGDDIDYINFKYFPISPAWLLPSSNYETFFYRCRLSLSTYRKEDYI